MFHKFLSFSLMHEMNTRYLLFKVNLLRYIWTILPSSISQIASLFPFYLSKLLRFICKIFLEMRFYFAYWIETVYHGENFLITRTSNSRIEQDLGNTEDRMPQSNCNSFSLTMNANDVEKSFKRNTVINEMYFKRALIGRLKLMP